MSFQSILRWAVAALLLCVSVVAAQAGERNKARLDAVSLKSLSDCCDAGPAPACKVYKPCVIYKGGCCGPTVPQTLRVKDPCDCCCSIAEIPVCLPACCKDPCVSSKCGLCGRAVVRYDYDCGVSVIVVFRKCGDVVVAYRGC